MYSNCFNSSLLDRSNRNCFPEKNFKQFGFITTIWIVIADWRRVVRRQKPHIWGQIQLIPVITRKFYTGNNFSEAINYHYRVLATCLRVGMGKLGMGGGLGRSYGIKKMSVHKNFQIDEAKTRMRSLPSIYRASVDQSIQKMSQLKWECKNQSQTIKNDMFSLPLKLGHFLDWWIDTSTVYMYAYY